MSEAYNPETKLYQQLESLELEARELVRKRDEAATGDDRSILERQLKEIEKQVESLKRKLKP